VRKCLAKDPDRRWQTASDLRDELEWIAAAPADPSPQAMVAAPHGKRRSGPLVLASLASLSAGFLIAAFWPLNLQESRPIFVRILYRRLQAVRSNSLTLLSKHAEHGFDVWNQERDGA